MHLFYNFSVIKIDFVLFLNQCFLPLPYAAKKKAFEAKRKAHYREYYAVKIMRTDEDEEVEEEDEDAAAERARRAAEEAHRAALEALNDEASAETGEQPAASSQQQQQQSTSSQPGVGPDGSGGIIETSDMGAF